nr:M3 family oligoendopeptidase [candidate division Zixibacteria bacterium]
MNQTPTTAKTPTWDLDSIFPGGSTSTQYAAFREDIRKRLKATVDDFHRLPRKLDDSNLDAWTEFIIKLQDLFTRINHASAFAECLVSQNVDDNKAHQIQGEIDVFESELQKIFVLFESFAENQSDTAWEKLVTGKELVETRFFLDEMRRTARLKMEPQFEALATDLAVNGYHAWNRLYGKIYGDLRVDFKENGKTVRLSVGQLNNKFNSPDREIRKQAFEKLEEAWGSTASVAAMALNFQAGFRLTLYEKRKWESPLLEPLLNSRIKEETLKAMWSAVAKAAPQIKKYIEAKKKILGIDGFKWYDQFSQVGEMNKSYTFNEAADFIIDNLGAFNKNQADFTRMAIDRRWVEAEDRAGKAGGAFCTGLDFAKQSRVLMTFSQNLDSMMTLAHELGHAYHQYILKDTPRFAAEYPMTLAETASIFNELLISDAALEKADGVNEKLLLLDLKLQNAYILFCNIYARFLFDTAFYRERKSGLLSRERLDEIMIESQKKAFMGTLDDDGYHPLFWCSKLHFYITDNPFYNFPYTFGYLFAGGVYNRAREEGPSFADKYIALMADTGKMTSEDVARKHMGVDLTGEEFWNDAVSRCMADVELFVKLVNQKK